MLSYAGYLGILAGLWSRRASAVYVAATALVLLVGLCDAPYLALDLAPGQAVARLGTERLGQPARPVVAAAGARFAVRHRRVKGPGPLPRGGARGGGEGRDVPPGARARWLGDRTSVSARDGHARDDVAHRGRGQSVEAVSALEDRDETAPRVGVGDFEHQLRQLHEILIGQGEPSQRVAQP